jgi:hypothetical protein
MQGPFGGAELPTSWRYVKPARAAAQATSFAALVPEIQNLDRAAAVRVVSR